MFERKLLMIGALFAAACGTERVTTLTQEAAQPFRGALMRDYDCKGPAESRCADIAEMIESLEGHSDARCRERGAAARARYEAPSGTAGFYLRDIQYTSYDAYVIMQPDNTKSSGEGPTDNYTYVEPSSWNNGFSGRRGLVAHEEDHESGIENSSHTTGEAATTQSRCS